MALYWTMPISHAFLNWLRGELGSEVRLAGPVAPLARGYCAVYSFRLLGAPPEWSGPLVLRVLPASEHPGMALRERAFQNGAAAQGFPTPSVLAATSDPSLLGGGFLVMERLDGRPPVADRGLAGIARSAPWILRRMASQLAATLSHLHRLDSSAVVHAIDADCAGVTQSTKLNWARQAGENASEGTSQLLADLRAAARIVGTAGLRPGLEWLQLNRPGTPARRVICHGDLWHGQLLADRGRPTGALDWTLATVDHPALDAGFTTFALRVPPARLPRAVQPLSRMLARQFLDAYGEATDVDMHAVVYYEAMRTMIELLCALRRRAAQGRDETWGAAQLAAHFSLLTGVELQPGA